MLIKSIYFSLTKKNKRSHFKGVALVGTYLAKKHNTLR